MQTVMVALTFEGWHTGGSSKRAKKRHVHDVYWSGRCTKSARV